MSLFFCGAERKDIQVEWRNVQLYQDNRKRTSLEPSPTSHHTYLPPRTTLGPNHSFWYPLPRWLSPRRPNDRGCDPYIPNSVKSQSSHGPQREPLALAKPFAELALVSHNSRRTQHLAGPGLRSHRVAAVITSGSGFQRNPPLQQR